MLIPALSAAKKDLVRDNLTAAEGQFIVQATHEIVEELSLQPLPSTLPDTTFEAALAPNNNATSLPKVPIILCPVHDETDVLALLMLQHMLDPSRYKIESLGATVLTAEVLSLVEQRQVQLICLGGIAPGGMAHTRYLCKRLRTRFSDLKIVVGRWGFSGNSAESQHLLRQAGADAVETTLHDTCSQLMQFASLSTVPLSQTECP